MAFNLNKFHLNKLKDLVRIPNGKASMYVEACVWCMDQHGHPNGIELDLFYDRKTHIHPISWLEDDIDINKIRAHYNIDDALSFGAEAIAIFACITHTDFDDIQRSIRKTGIDYWLGYKDADPNLPFQNSGRLEISGILSENEKNSVEKRVKEKLKQAEQSAKTTLPVYVVVVAFDRPYAKMVVKNANS
jgi:hypothetical protein